MSKLKEGDKVRLLKSLSGIDPTYEVGAVAVIRSLDAGSRLFPISIMAEGAGVALCFAEDELEFVESAEDAYEYAVEETSKSGVVRLVSVFPEWGTLEDKRELVASFRDYAQNEAKHWGGEARLTYKIVRRPVPAPYEVVEGE